MPVDFQVTMDSADPHALCDFWAAALGYDVEPTDEAFIRRMVDEGHAKEEQTLVVKGELRWADGAACVDPEGKRPRMYFQRVPEAKAGKNRVHLDLRMKDKEAEVARLTGSGRDPPLRGEPGPAQLGHHGRPRGQRVLRRLTQRQHTMPSVRVFWARAVVVQGLSGRARCVLKSCSRAADHEGLRGATTCPPADHRRVGTQCRITDARSARR